MQAVILAAGRGTRMRHLTEDIPKPMLTVGDMPLLAHKIEMLPDRITEVVIVIGYKGHMIVDYFGSSHAGREITYVFQDTLNGTGGAIHYAADILKEPFLVLMGDDLYLKEDLERLMQHELALLAYEHHDAREFGLVAIDENFRLIDVMEKPKTSRRGLINTGAYMVTPRFFDRRPVKISETEYGLPQTLAQMSSKRTPVRVIRARAWHPMTSPDDIERATYLIESFRR